MYYNAGRIWKPMGDPGPKNKMLKSPRLIYFVSNCRAIKNRCLCHTYSVYCESIATGQYCSAVIHTTSIGVATKQDSPHLWHQEGAII